MPREYLAFVVVYNLPVGDYDNRTIAKIEKAINAAITKACSDEGTKQNVVASDENMIFSFPKDSSVMSSTIPIVVEVKPYSFTGEIEIGVKKAAIESKIEKSLKALLHREGDVVVRVYE